jgi:hypothetical protein
MYEIKLIGGNRAVPAQGASATADRSRRRIGIFNMAISDFRFGQHVRICRLVGRQRKVFHDVAQQSQGTVQNPV